MICIHVLISGKVQGVYFRDHTRQFAQKLHLTGWVRNLADGRAEAIVCGSEGNLRKFIDWLWEGSPSSKVSGVCWELIAQQAHADFIIRYDNLKT